MQTSVLRAGVVAATVAAAEAVFLALHNAAGIDLAVRAGGSVRHVGAAGVGVTALVVALAGWALLTVLERATGRGRLVWTVIALAVLVVSLLGAAGGTGLSARLGLAALHVTVGAVVIVGLPLAGRPSPRPAR